MLHEVFVARRASSPYARSMSGPDDPPFELIETRPCGTCNVCCVSLTIDDDELQKPQGYRCRNANRDNSCAIYHSRPNTCRKFYCGWRSLRWVRETLRPDLSGVLVRLHIGYDADGTRQDGVVISLLTSKALAAEGLAETVAAAVAAEIPVYLHVPGPPGYTSAQARVNDALRGAVMAKDKTAVLGILREGRALGRKGAKKRIVLKPRPGPAPSV